MTVSREIGVLHRALNNTCNRTRQRSRLTLPSAGMCDTTAVLRNSFFVATTTLVTGQMRPLMVATEELQQRPLARSGMALSWGNGWDSSDRSGNDGKAAAWNRHTSWDDTATTTGATVGDSQSWDPRGVDPTRQSTFDTKAPHYRIFYDKKLSPELEELLTQDRLQASSFLGWWERTSITSDFWLEGEFAWHRIHVTPRRVLCNPSTWKTQATVQRGMLLESIGNLRVTEGFCCRTVKSHSRSRSIGGRTVKQNRLSRCSGSAGALSQSAVMAVRFSL